MRFPRAWAALAFLETVALSGCPEVVDPNHVPSSSAGMPVAGEVQAPPDGQAPTAEASTGSAGTTGLTVCNTQPLVQNTVASDGALQVTLLELDPAPPRIYTNEWIVEIKDENGQPVTDAASLRVQPWMRAHGHGARYPPTIVALETPGQFQIATMNLHMKGTWDIRFMRAEDEEKPDQWTIVLACVTDA